MQDQFKVVYFSQGGGLYGQVFADKIQEFLNSRYEQGWAYGGQMHRPVGASTEIYLCFEWDIVTEVENGGGGEEEADGDPQE